MECKVTKEKVLEAAKTSVEAEEALKILFPEVFESEYFDFGKEKLITTSFYVNDPLMIGEVCTKKREDVHKILLLNSRYELEVIPNYYSHLTGLKFKKKY